MADDGGDGPPCDSDYISNLPEKRPGHHPVPPQARRSGAVHRPLHPLAPPLPLHPPRLQGLRPRPRRRRRREHHPRRAPRRARPLLPHRLALLPARGRPLRRGLAPGPRWPRRQGALPLLPGEVAEDPRVALRLHLPQAPPREQLHLPGRHPGPRAARRPRRDRSVRGQHIRGIARRPAVAVHGAGTPEDAEHGLVPPHPRPV
ncbi:hypothetical protein EE612_005500 [Oryza sativa]|nr:hypothetical protein EE612_005500 [Oryza sativa]